MLTKSLMILAELVAINWVLLITASLMRVRVWTGSGLMLALGNREGLPAATGFVGRTDRAGRNMLENLVLFGALVLVASAAGITDPKIELGARLFFWARLLYIPIYMAGIPVARTAAWMIGVIGMALIFTAIAQALPFAI